MRILSRKASRTEQKKSDLFSIGTQLNVDKAYTSVRDYHQLLYSMDRYPSSLPSVVQLSAPLSKCGHLAD